jgi:hypothetical protein
MTIVIQNQYWDLKVNETGFEVGLSFDGIPETLVIPFSAVKGFFDPSVQFGLQFDPATAPGASAVEAEADNAVAAAATGSSAEGEKPGEKVVSLDAFRKKP